MKGLLVASLVCFVAGLVVGQKTYPEEFDRLDIDTFLQDLQKVDSFISCLLNNADCSDRAAKIKAVLLDALETKCSKCTEIQKGHIKKALNFIIENRPEAWEKVVNAHDPQHNHEEDLKKFLQEG